MCGGLVERGGKGLAELALDSFSSFFFVSNVFHAIVSG